MPIWYLESRYFLRLWRRFQKKRMTGKTMGVIRRSLLKPVRMLFTPLTIGAKSALMDSMSRRIRCSCLSALSCRRLRWYSRSRMLRMELSSLMAHLLFCRSNIVALLRLLVGLLKQDGADGGKHRVDKQLLAEDDSARHDQQP